eukprot:TRINITY_DN17981_c0_g1_i1.p2 TRINITY_DN17981_c0_g1~~TRINITY_DN17981_c0_g1_i1.p2  ORF type:complete len:144 (+),score=39.23 TRINITY_DN17981_c0_g1_i1:52-432(+)
MQTNLVDMSGWILCGYTGDNTVALTATGRGTSSELRTHIKDDQIQYAVVRVQAKNKDFVEPRDVFIRFIGSSVSTLKKGKMSTHVGKLQAVLSPTKGHLECTNVANMTDELIAKLTNAGTGSHVID